MPLAEVIKEGHQEMLFFSKTIHPVGITASAKSLVKLYQAEGGTVTQEVCPLPHIKTVPPCFHSEKKGAQLSVYLSDRRRICVSQKGTLLGQILAMLVQQPQPDFGRTSS